MRLRVLAALGVLALGGAPTLAVPGDLNGVNGVTAEDAAIAVHIAGGLMPSVSFHIANGDVASASGPTGDQRLTILDAVRIVRAANGLDNLGGGPAGTQPLPLYTTLAVSGPTVKDYKLPAGFKLSGTVTHTGPHAPDSIYFFPTSGGMYMGGYSAIQAGAYSTIVGAGTFTPHVSTGISEEDEENFITYDYSVSQPLAPNVTVSADTTQNYARGALPAVSLVTATVDSTWEVYDVSYNVQGNGYTGDASTSMDDMGDWVAKVPVGQVYADLSGYVESNGRNVSVDVTLANPFTVGASPVTRTITTPNLVNVTGTITPPAGRTLHSVQFLSASTTGNHVYADYQYGGFSGNPADNGYLMAVPPGRYRVEINLVKIAADEPSWEYITEVDVTGAGPKNFTLPALPAVRAVSGTVTGPTGAPISAYVMADSTDTALNAWHASNSATSNAQGQYAYTLPNGSYNVMVFKM